MTPQGFAATTTGGHGLAIALTLAGTVLFTLLVAALGRLLAASHPGPAPSVPPAPAAPPPPAGLPADPALFVAIAAAVAVTLRAPVRVRAITAVPNPDARVESLMQAWALEGRRQIYSSHRVR